MDSSSKKKILLAEDDDSMRRLLEVILTKADFEVIAAGDGVQAMKLALENDVSAVVADAIMPGLTGYDLCRMLKTRADKKNVPMIILSGLSDGGDGDSAKCSADVFLSKSPKLKDELIETLKNLI